MDLREIKKLIIIEDVFNKGKTLYKSRNGEYSSISESELIEKTKKEVKEAYEKGKKEGRIEDEPLRQWDRDRLFNLEQTKLGLNKRLDKLNTELDDIKNKKLNKIQRIVKCIFKL